MPPLDDDHSREALAGSEWRLEGAAIVRDARFADFASAMAFVNRVASWRSAPITTRTCWCTAGIACG